MGEEHGMPHVVEPLIDLHLQMLVQLAEESEDNRFPITINVPGTIISGYLVASAAWRTRWVERIGAMSGEGKELLSFFPDQVRAAVDEILEEQGESRKDLPVRWMHLLDVRMVTGAANTTVYVPLWRGRLADISGWTFGLPD
ncbi:hypothetical protein ACWGKO_16695 [Streptomyces griseoincarnatus]